MCKELSRFDIEELERVRNDAGSLGTRMADLNNYRGRYDDEEIDECLDEAFKFHYAMLENLKEALDIMRKRVGVVE